MPRASATRKTPLPDLPAEPVANESDIIARPTDDLDLGFVTLEDTEDTINALYYGTEGTGKTTAVAAMANLPGPGKVLVINSEGGLKKLALTKRGIDTSAIVVWPRPGVRITKDGLEALYERVRSDLTDDPESWKGVAFDSITEIATILRENATTKRQAGLDAKGTTYDPDFIDIGDYGVQSDHAKRILRKFRDLPCHFAITALDRVDDSGTHGPELNPALASAVLGYVDFVLYCRATQPTAESAVDEETPAEFRAATRPGKTYRAKDRFDVLPRVLAAPTFDRVASYVSGDLVEEDDALQSEYLERKAERDAKLAAEKAEREARKAAARKRG